MIRAATSAVAPPGGPARAATPSVPPRHPLLEPLHDLPGLTRARLVDASGNHVLADVGDDDARDDTVGAVLDWGRRAAAVAVDRELVLDDLIVTTDVAHHLLRRLDTPSAPGAWVYLRVRRDQGNLALARRRLAAVGTVRTLALEPGRATPAPEPARIGPSRRPTSAAIPAAASPVSTPVSTPGSTPVPSPVSTPVPTPPSLPSTRARRPSATSPTAPTAPTAPWPTRAPGRTPTAPDPAPVATPLAPAPPAPPPSLPGPRRPAAAAAPPEPVPFPDPAPRRVLPDSAGVLGQRWRSDPDTLRRVLAGLLRLGRAPQAALTGSPAAIDPTAGPRSPATTTSWRKE